MSVFRKAVVVSILMLSIQKGQSGIVEDSRTVTVQGTALQRVLPDTLIWNLTVSSENTRLSVALESAEKNLQMLVTARENLGLSADEFQAGNIDVNKSYHRDSNGNQSFKGYRATRNVRIVQKDLTKFGTFLEELTKTGKVELNMQYEASTMNEIRAETRLEAVKAARAKAEAMAGVLGGAVGRVLKLEEPGPQAPDPYGRNFGAFANNTFSSSITPAAVEDLSSGTFSPSAMEVRVTVQATFELN